MIILTKLSIISSSFGRFGTVLDGRNWTKQVLSSFFHFVRKKQVLDGKNPTLFAGNKTVDHSDVVGALPVGAASTASSFLDY